MAIDFEVLAVADDDLVVEAGQRQVVVAAEGGETLL